MIEMIDPASEVQVLLEAILILFNIWSQNGF